MTIAGVGEVLGCGTAALVGVGITHGCGTVASDGVTVGTDLGDGTAGAGVVMAGAGMPASDGAMQATDTDGEVMAGTDLTMVATITIDMALIEAEGATVIIGLQEHHFEDVQI